MSIIYGCEWKLRCRNDINETATFDTACGNCLEIVTNIYAQDILRYEKIDYCCFCEKPIEKY